MVPKKSKAIILSIEKTQSSLNVAFGSNFAGSRCAMGFFSDPVMAALRYFNFVYEEPIPQLGGTGDATEQIEEKETQAASYVAESEDKLCVLTFAESHVST